LAHETAGNDANGPAVFVDTRGCYVATEKQLAALLGVENLVVVTTADVVLVARREASDGLRRVGSVSNSARHSPSATAPTTGASYVSGARAQRVRNRAQCSDYRSLRAPSSLGA
jgi:hypothetical protein